MDFFAAGGFQQLFNDLEDTELQECTADHTNDLGVFTELESYDYCTTLPTENNNTLVRLTSGVDPFVLSNTNNEQTLLELHVDWTADTVCTTLDSNNNNNNNHSSDGLYTYEFRVIHDMEQQLQLDQLLVTPTCATNELTYNPHTLHDLQSAAVLSENELNNVSSTESIESNSLHELETAAFITREMAEWEAKFLDNYIEIPELIDFLPEKTPLCTETCEHFLHESSKNLKLHRKVRATKRTHIHSTANNTTHTSTSTSNTEERTAAGYTCNFGSCDKVYAKPAHLKAHMRRHMGDKPYICNWPECTWKFSRSDELARHRRSHSGVKPYKCNFCMKCFARSDHLTKHRKVHERRLLAASKAGKTFDGVLPHSVFTVRPGRKRKNQLC